MQRRSVTIVLSSLMVMVAACVPQAAPPVPRIVGVQALGPVADPAVPDLFRDGGASGRVGDRLLWTFGDTIFPRKSVGDASNLRSNTAALADPASPVVVTEPLDANRTPFPLLPFTPDEQAYNDASGRPDERIALWPEAVIPIAPDRALVYYVRLKVHPGNLNYEPMSTGIAEVRAGETTARRLGELFTVPEPQFHHSPFLKEGMIYLYQCQNSGPPLQVDCRLGRVAVADAVQREAYRFWDGAGWNADIAKAALAGPGSTSGYSVAWNEYLGVYVALASPPFDKRVVLRIARQPQGPWSEPVTVLTAESPIYAAFQHESLAKDGGRVLFVTYFRSTGGFSGEIPLFEITLER